jgi:hypothetical protein
MKGALYIHIHITALVLFATRHRSEYAHASHAILYGLVLQVIME